MAEQMMDGEIKAGENLWCVLNRDKSHSLVLGRTNNGCIRVIGVLRLSSPISAPNLTI